MPTYVTTPISFSASSRMFFLTSDQGGTPSALLYVEQIGIIAENFLQHLLLSAAHVSVLNNLLHINTSVTINKYIHLS